MKMRLALAALLAASVAMITAVEAGPPRSRQMAILGGGNVPSFLPPAMRAAPPDVFVNFKTNQAWIRSSNTVTTSDAVITTTRSSPSTQFDSAGNLIQCSANAQCRSDLGVANWEGRTNSVANSTATGAVVGVLGSGGALPTSWSLRSAGGLTTTVVGTGLESGLGYIDLRFAGTSTGTVQLQFSPSTVVTAVSYGQTWSAAASVYQTAGASIAGLTNQFFIFTFQANGTSFVSSYSSSVAIPSSGPISTARFSRSFTFTNPADATAAFILSIGLVATNSYDFTVRVALPQFENNSTIGTGVSSATVNAGGSGFTGASGTMTWSGSGCTTNPILNVTASAGAITAVNSVATPGTCSPFPPAAATTWTPGGGLAAGTGASFNLTPQSQSTRAFSTNPILTSGAAASRSAETNVLNVATGPFSSSFSGYVRATPASPISSSNIQSFMDFNDGTQTNRVSLRRLSGTATIATGGAGNIGTAMSIAPVWAAGASGRIAARFTNGDSALAFGGVIGTSAAAAAGIPSQVNIGQTIGPSFSANANVEEAAIWYQGIPNSVLLSLSP